MPFVPDPEFLAAFAPIAAAAEGLVPPPVGDVATRRVTVEATQTAMHSALPMPDDVEIADYATTTPDGATLLLRWYAKRGSSPGSAVLYAHGGGMILSSVAIYDGPVARYVSASGVPFLSVEYRYAPEYPAPVPVEDCYAGLRWLAGHAADLGVDTARIAVMGDSGGGGVAAGLAVLVRDRQEPWLAKQILVYPMLDDRSTVPDPLLLPFLTWTYDDNATGWTALLGELAGGPLVPAQAAPARIADPAGLAPIYLDVGELDLFRDEGIEYARRAAAAGVSTELHVYPGVPHAWEIFTPQITVSQQAFANRVRAITTF
jgi:acetyl esterase/lipase